MATISALRQELAAVLDLRDAWTGDPPYYVAFVNGTDFEPILGDGHYRLGFRITAVGGGASDDTAMAALDSMAEEMVSAVHGLDGWRLDGLGPVAMRDVNGTQMYTVDLNVSAMVEV